MKTEVDLFSLFQKTVKEFEKKHGELTFSIIKENEKFIFTKVSDLLLKYMNLQKANIIGKNLDNIISYLGENTYHRLEHEMYPIAWSGKTIVFYCTLKSSEKLLFITILIPQLCKGTVTKINGKCVALRKKDFLEELSTLEKLPPFVIMEN